MRKISIFLPATLVILFLILSLPCDKYLTCEGKAMDILQYPGLWFLILVPLGLFSLILNDQKHKSWLIFTGVFFSASMFFVFLLPEYDSAIVSMDKELGNWFFAGLYTFISIIYFIVQFFKNRKIKK
ncbi:MAG TPA: hypothetical protein VGC58_02550 [Candidatus Paceibacterota bacterium]